MTPWTVALQGSLSITNTQSLYKLMSIESVIPSSVAASPLALNLSQHQVLIQ